MQFSIEHDDGTIEEVKFSVEDEHLVGSRITFLVQVMKDTFGLPEKALRKALGVKQAVAATAAGEKVDPTPLMEAILRVFAAGWRLGGRRDTEKPLPFDRLYFQALAVLVSRLGGKVAIGPDEFKAVSTQFGPFGHTGVALAHDPDHTIRLWIVNPHDAGRIEPEPDPKGFKPQGGAA